MVDLAILRELATPPVMILAEMVQRLERRVDEAATIDLHTLDRSELSEIIHEHLLNMCIASLCRTSGRHVRWWVVWLWCGAACWCL